MNNFCLLAQELEHFRLKFYHKTQDAIFSHYFASITTNKIVKNLRPNGKKKKKNSQLSIPHFGSPKIILINIS